MKEQLKQYLEQLNERERRMVYAAAIALALYLPWQLLWVPFSNAIENAAERVATQEQDLLWMQDKLAEIRQLSSMGAGTGGASGQSIYGVVESTAQQKFTGEIRIQQEGTGGVRVVLRNAAFDELMIWLDDLHTRYKANVAELKVDRESAPGRVSVSILIEG